MPFRAKVAQLVQEQLRRQGIGVEIRMIPSEVLYSHVAPHGQFNLGEWSELTGAEPLPSLIYGCSEIPKKPSWTGKNRAAWCNEQANALMKKADQTVDVEARASLVKQVNEIIADEVPMLPLFQSPDVVAWNNAVQGLNPNPTSNHTWNMDEWWVDR
jgi:peptide/nickel transport system substrate-binding protein